MFLISSLTLFLSSFHELSPSYNLSLLPRKKPHKGNFLFDYIVLHELFSLVPFMGSVLFFFYDF